MNSPLPLDLPCRHTLSDIVSYFLFLNDNWLPCRSKLASYLPDLYFWLDLLLFLDFTCLFLLLTLHTFPCNGLDIYFPGLVLGITQPCWYSTFLTCPLISTFITLPYIYIFYSPALDLNSYYPTLNFLPWSPQPLILTFTTMYPTLDLNLSRTGLEL